MMMDEFVVVYFPGGMGLDYGAWWLCKRTLSGGVFVDIQMKKLRVNKEC